MLKALNKWKNLSKRLHLRNYKIYSSNLIPIDRSSLTSLTRVLGINRSVATTFISREAPKEDDNTENSSNSEESTSTLDDRERRLKVLQLEVDIGRQEGRRIPHLDFFNEKHWEYILTLRTKSARLKYYAYLWQIQIKRENRKRLKEEKAVTGKELKNKVLQERAENNHIIYGLGHASMFLRIYDATITNWMNYRLIRAMQFSPKIILDCSYDNDMNKREAENAAKQLMLTFAENRAHDDPFDIHFCNVNLNSICMRSLQKFMPTMLNPEFPMNIHEKCFTELFPKDKLIYLTPHCRTDLTEYNPDDIYIIGAIVDTGDNKPLSLAKAKRLGIRMARFPLDQYLQWGAGSGKSLTLNQVTRILLDLRKTGDWLTALKHVPKRKLHDLTEDSENLRNSLNRRANQLNLSLKEILTNSNTSSETLNAVHSYKNPSQFTWRNKKKNIT